MKKSKKIFKVKLTQDQLDKLKYIESCWMYDESTYSDMIATAVEVFAENLGYSHYMKEVMGKEYNDDLPF